jgi:hypothetical protein
MELGGGNGESAAKRTRLSTGEDRLSALPNEVLVLILLKLSTRAAAQTSVLSRSWRRVWALLPTLSFDETAKPDWLRDALDGHEVPVRSLHVGAHGAAAGSLGVWLPAAARRVTGDLSLCSYVRVSEEEDGEAPPQRGVFELPCFDKATSVKLFLSFHGLAVPRAGVFARLADLHLYRVWLHGPGELGDAVSSPRCPCLLRLTVDDARGLADLTIRSDTLLEVELRNLRSLSQLTVAAPALKELTVVLCFVKNRPVANISAPLLTNLDWGDEYDPSSVRLGKMEHLRSLGTDCYLVYGNYAFIHNHFWLSLLQRFEGIQTLSLTLMYLRVSSHFSCCII